ncbi:MAG: hypothetical protein AAFV85_25475 [Cyanobacteria bacterium J06634_6]
MSISKRVLGTLSLSLLAMGVGVPAQAQTVLTAESTFDNDVLNESAVVVDTEATFPGEVAADSTITPEALLIEQPELIAEGFSLDDLRIESEAILHRSGPAIATPENSVDVSVESSPVLAPEIAVTTTEPALETSTTQPVTEASELAYPALEEPTELAQRRPRRRTTGARGGSNYIGIGADFGYADDFSFATISKFELTDKLAIRPSLLFGDDFSVLVPVTYDFTAFNSNVGGFPLSPYAGVGASYTSGDGDDDINLLLSAGLDIPLSQQFTANAQVNWGVLNDSEFGVTVGVGYNLGNFFR